MDWKKIMLSKKYKGKSKKSLFQQFKQNECLRLKDEEIKRQSKQVAGYRALIGWFCWHSTQIRLGRCLLIGIFIT